MLIGFRNRVVVLFEWAIAFLTFQRGARLITGAIDRDVRDVGSFDVGGHISLREASRHAGKRSDGHTLPLDARVGRAPRVQSR